MIFFSLSSGLFLGWSLGANDAANIFGTAVGSRMIRFRTAALLAGLFVTIGAVISGAGASDTLGALGAVNALGGAFTVALAAALSVTWMTRLKLPVSTSQAIVGSIIGWNFFTHNPTDWHVLKNIALSWVTSPILAALFSAVIFIAFRAYLKRIRLHLLHIDMHTRIGLIMVGIMGAYSLGANNIANVMGVFVSVVPLRDFHWAGWVITGREILFFIGGLAIALGIFTYSRKVMETVGGSLLKLTPTAAFVVVLSEALVLFLFSSVTLHNHLQAWGLPALPLVPISSSQLVIGGVLGIGLVKGGHGIRWRVLTEIAAGWIATPVLAGVISFILLFIMRNVFAMTVAGAT
ncbi:MAG: anion permease [Calditrichaeota bacterium]|nr:MAG: anion permease [Calditrichota bacterium]